MIYKLIYSRLARKDVEEIIFYVRHKLKNKKAANNLKNEFIIQEKNILTFPYGASVYNISNSLNFEYRRVAAKNFQIFYIIDEDKKIIIISRVLYSKRNMEKLLK